MCGGRSKDKLRRESQDPPIGFDPAVADSFTPFPLLAPSTSTRYSMLPPLPPLPPSSLPLQQASPPTSSRLSVTERRKEKAVPLPMSDRTF